MEAILIWVWSIVISWTEEILWLLTPTEIGIQEVINVLQQIQLEQLSAEKQNSSLPVSICSHI